MTVASGLRALVLLQLASGGLALVVAGSETVLSGWAMIAIVLLAVLTGGPWPRDNSRRTRIWNILSVFALFLFIGELVLTSELLPTVTRLVVFISAFKLFNLVSNRDYYSIFMLSFLQILSAASISYDYMFALPFLLFTISSSVGMILFMLKIGKEQAQYHRSFVNGYPPSTENARLRPKQLARSIAIALVVLLLTIAIFPLLPRLRTNVLAPGNYDYLQRISGFSQIVDLEAIADIKSSPRVVMRVSFDKNADVQRLRPKIRGIVLNYFDGQRWSHSFRGGRTIRRSQDGNFYLPGRAVGTKVSQEILLNPFNTRVIFNAGIAEKLKGPFGTIYADSMDSLFMIRPIFNRFRYSVDTVLPDLSPGGLRGIQNQPVDGIMRMFLQLPNSPTLTKDDMQRARELALEITSSADDLYGAMSRLEQFFKREFTYSLDLRPYAGKRSKTMSFLFDRRSGHCGYFASTMTLMARSIGVPARLVNGFQLGQYNPVGDFFTVRAADAHSWVEVYFPGKGWVDFDPTPAGGQQSEFAAQEQDFFSGFFDSLDMMWSQYVLAFDPYDQRDLLAGIKEGLSSVLDLFNKVADTLLALIPQFDETSSLYPTFRFVLLLILLAGAGLLLYLAVLKPLRRWKNRSKYGSEEQRVAFFERTRKILRKHGYPVEPSQTARELAAATAGDSYGGLVSEIVECYEQMRFGGHGTSRHIVSVAVNKVSQLKKAISRGNFTGVGA